VLFCPSLVDIDEDKDEDEDEDAEDDILFLGCVCRMLDYADIQTS